MLFQDIRTSHQKRIKSLEECKSDVKYKQKEALQLIEKQADLIVKAVGKQHKETIKDVKRQIKLVKDYVKNKSTSGRGELKKIIDKLCTDLDVIDSCLYDLGNTLSVASPWYASPESNDIQHATILKPNYSARASVRVPTFKVSVECLSVAEFRTNKIAVMVKCELHGQKPVSEPQVQDRSCTSIFTRVYL